MKNIIFSVVIVIVCYMSCAEKHSAFMMKHGSLTQSEKKPYKQKIFDSIQLTLDKKHNIVKGISKIIFSYTVPSNKQIELYLKQNHFNIEETKNHCNINKISGRGLHQHTPLSKAIKEKNQKALKLILLHTKLNINQVFNKIKQWTPIFISDYQTTKTLLYHGANPNHQDGLGDTPLHNTLAIPEVDKFLILLSIVDPNIKNTYGNTVLHLASIYKTKNNMNLIIQTLENDERVDKKLKNNKNQTYLDILNQ